MILAAASVKTQEQNQKMTGQHPRLIEAQEEVRRSKKKEEWASELTVIERERKGAHQQMMERVCNFTCEFEIQLSGLEGMVENVWSANGTS